MKPFILKLDNKTHTALKTRAASEEKTMQELINEVLADFLSGLFGADNVT